MGKTISHNFGGDEHDYPIRGACPEGAGRQPPSARPSFNLTAIRFTSYLVSVPTMISIGCPRRFFKNVFTVYIIK